MDFEKLARIRLRRGAGGGDPQSGFCVMELVSWISGDDRATDAPSCASPALTAFAIALNDSAADAALRDTLKPLALRLVNSRDGAHERRRRRYLLQASARGLLAPVLAALGLEGQARALRAARTRRDVRRAARAAAAGLSNIGRSVAWANARAAAARLAEAARDDGDKTLLALRDAAYCALSAPGDGNAKRALWRHARASLVAAIDLGRSGALDAPLADRVEEIPLSPAALATTNA
jgi:hypothetical protein